MKKLKLRVGDKVTIVTHYADTNKVSVLTVTKPHHIEKQSLLIESPLFDFVEYVGISPTKREVTEALAKIPSRFQTKLKRIEVLEIERKKPWYITILRKLLFWRKK